jgi:hypothetical protein
MYGLEKRVQLPPVDLPGSTAGEVLPSVFGTDPIKAAQTLRKAWGFGMTPIPRMIRLLEAHGLIVIAKDKRCGRTTPFILQVKRGFSHIHRYEECNHTCFAAVLRPSVQVVGLRDQQWSIPYTTGIGANLQEFSIRSSPRGRRCYAAS